MRGKETEPMDITFTIQMATHSYRLISWNHRLFITSKEPYDTTLPHISPPMQAKQSLST